MSETTTDYDAVRRVAGSHAVIVTDLRIETTLPGKVAAVAEEVVPEAAGRAAIEAIEPLKQSIEETAGLVGEDRRAVEEVAGQVGSNKTLAEAAANGAVQARGAAQVAEGNAVAAATSSQSGAGLAAQARAQAEAAALNAGNAAALAAATANIFADVAAGLAAATEGNTFTVQGIGDAFSTTYRKTGGNAVFVSQVASKTAVDKAVGRFRPDSRASLILQLADKFGFALDFIAYLNGGLRTKTLRHNVPGAPAPLVDVFTDRWGFVRAAVKEASFEAFGVKLFRGGARPAISAVDGQGVLLEGARFVERPLPAGVALAVVDAYGSGMLSVGQKGIAANLTTPAEPKPGEGYTPNLSPLYSGDVFLVPGQKLTLYPRNLFRLRSDAAYAEVTFDSAGYVVSNRGDGELAIDADRCGSAGTLTIARRDLEDQTRLTIALTIRKALQAGQAPRVLMLGDSITNRQQALLTQAKLQGLGISPIYLGTVPGSSSPTSTTNGDGPLGEAREGRAFADYVYSVLDGEATPLPIGQEIAYLAASKAEKVSYNPFIRPATIDDPGSLVRNGYVFDFRFYLDRFSIPNPHVLWINLGENDIIENSSGAAAAASVADGLAIVLAQARAAVPAMKIGVALSGQPSTPDGEERWAKKALVLQTMIAAVRALNDPLIYLVPTWAHVSPAAGWNRAAGNTDNLGVNTATISDHVHPYGSARQQLADATAAFIAFAAS